MAVAEARAQSQEQISRRVALGNVLVSLTLAGPLLWVALRFDSKLALSQAADSFNDSATACALLYSIWLARHPADENHPRGHQRAEPIAALLTAVMAGVLAVEVLREAIGALLAGELPVMHYSLAAVFTVKVLARLAIGLIARSQRRRGRSPALRALEIDARNDVLVGVLSLLGFFAARFGSPGWDAILAIPLAGWIGASGLSLARENIGLLMGEAAPAERQEELAAIARATPGVCSVHQVSARYEGAWLEVHLHIVVDENLALRAAHDIAVAVEQRLTAQPDVLLATAHLDVDP